MDEHKDAWELVGDPKNDIEAAYAKHANRLKQLGNMSRLELANITYTPYSRDAFLKYHAEADSLTEKLKESIKNAPMERKAQLVANKQLRAMLDDNPELFNDKEEYKRVKNQLLAGSRRRIGAKSYQIDITDAEWEAIQAGAISRDKLSQILLHADKDRVKQLATPREDRSLKGPKLTRAKALIEAGYTYSEIADQLGVSADTIMKSIKGAK